MRGVLKSVLRETLGLFVDDGPFAAAIIGWIAGLGLLAWAGLIAPAWGGPLLFVGLAALLIGSALHRAGRP